MKNSVFIGKIFVLAFGFILSLAVLLGVFPDYKKVSGFSTGPPASVSGAPGEGNCTGCHSDFPVNSGGGSVAITGVPAEYSLNQNYQITVTVEQENTIGFGFQMTAIDSAGSEAGVITLPNQNPPEMQIIAGNVGGRMRKYVEHTISGIAGSASRSWTFTWKAPSTDIGMISFYAAGNAVNADGTPGGDQIYLTSVSTNPAAGCSYSLSSGTADVPNTSGGGSFNLTAATGCSWTASSNEGWLTVDPPTAGDGNATINYSYTANTGPARTGTITVGGETHTVNQAAGDVGPDPTRFDLDGDGKTDIGIFRPAPGEWWYLRSSDGIANAFQFGQTTDTIVPADFTGDGATDVAFWRDGEWFVLRSEDSSFFAFPFGTTGDIPVPGDFDGDGTADPAVFRPANATWYYIRSSDGGSPAIQFGLDGDIPIVEDYDGDGMDDLAVYRPSVSEWFLQRSTLGFIGFSFGAPGNATPAPADYTGDGAADIAFFNPNAAPGTNNWFVLRSEDSSFFAFPFGIGTDIPVPGDYDGDGIADPAVFRPGNNSWFLQQTTDGFEQVQFGIQDDIPIPSAYIP